MKKKEKKIKKQKFVGKISMKISSVLDLIINIQNIGIYIWIIIHHRLDDYKANRSCNL